MPDELANANRERINKALAVAYESDISNERGSKHRCACAKMRQKTEEKALQIEKRDRISCVLNKILIRKDIEFGNGIKKRKLG